MKSSTKDNERQEGLLEITNWAETEQKLGLDLEGSARRHKAFLRRRALRSAGDLLRMVLVYCLQGWSLQLMGVWALMQEIGVLSDVAILKRLRNCHAWLGELVYQLVRQRWKSLAESPSVKVRIRDATVICGPGSQGTQWRIHLKFDLGQHCLSGVEVTDAHGGETFARLPVEAGEIQIGDRGYAFASGIGALLAQNAHVVVRINWQNLPLRMADGTRFGLIAWLRELWAPAERSVWLETPQGRFALRVIACPLPPEATEQAHRRAREAARKKKHSISQETLLAAGFLLLVTNLPADLWPIERVLWLYRLRWQVELQFKAFKSLLGFDQLRCKDPKLVQTFLFGKLLMVLLLEGLTHQVHCQQPAWFTDPDRPVSPWRLLAWHFALLRQCFTGSFSTARFWECLPALERHFRCSPRARLNQLAWSQALLEHLSCNFSFFSC